MPLSLTADGLPETEAAKAAYGFDELVYEAHGAPLPTLLQLFVLANGYRKVLLRVDGEDRLRKCLEGKASLRSLLEEVEPGTEWDWVEFG